MIIDRSDLRIDRIYSPEATGLPAYRPVALLDHGARVNAELRRCLLPLLREALEVTGATAWIGASDSVALAALEFLAQSAGRKRIAVIGFDNSFESLCNDLTSYDFNLGGYAAALLDFAVTGRRLYKQEDGPDFVELPGMVVERKSTCPTLQ